MPVGRIFHRLHPGDLRGIPEPSKQQQQGMAYESPYYQVSQTSTLGDSNVVDQQPGRTERMQYGNYGHTAGEGQYHTDQQNGYQQQSGYNGGGGSSG